MTKTTYSDLEEPDDLRILQQAMEFRIGEIHTAMPGIVHQYNPERNTVDVQPALKRVLIHADGSTSTESYPKLAEVPILFPRGGGFAITWPLVVGDVVLLVFCQRSIDDWSIAGGEQVSTLPRKHALHDAIAIPGTSPVLSAIAGLNDTDMVIGLETGQGLINISPEGITIHSNVLVTIDAPDVALAGASGQPVARVGDSIKITPDSDPTFWAWLTGGLVPPVAPGVVPFTGPSITAKITSGSSKVSAE